MTEEQIIQKYLSDNGISVGLGMWILGIHALGETTINPTGQYINFIATTFMEVC